MIKIVKKKIPKETINKYGWKNPIYYEIKRGSSTLGTAQTKKEAEKLAKRYK